MKDITVNKAFVIDFINAQPDERPIKFEESDFGRSFPEAKCGCLLVHLHKSVFPDWQHNVTCGFMSATGFGAGQIGPRLHTNASINVGEMMCHKITTYGQLKKHLDVLFA